jgi:pyruvate/2-oxoglutarate dehydrogenase complex dihydrolipoamide acyltransferase (E2) component
MIYKLVVPGPIEDVEELRVLQWHGAIGKAFVAREMIVELETHKAVVEVRAARPGVLRQILCAAGDWEKIGQPLALFSDEADEALPESAEVAAPLLVEFEIT